MKPVTPNASTESEKLLKQLYSYKGTHTLSAQHDYISSGTTYADRIEAEQGMRPLIWGSDFSFLYTGKHPKKIRHCGPANLPEPGIDDENFKEIDLHEKRMELVQRCIKQHQRGHMITLMWHGPIPTLGHSCRHNQLWSMGKTFSDTDWHNLVTAGTDMHTAWLQQVDDIAFYLKKLKEAHIPILWRPYHEMNGVWFWWCNRPGPQGYARLWALLFERLVEHHQLNNLIWVWNTNAPRDRVGDEAYPYQDFYPDPTTVDILAADVYHNDYQQSHYDDLLELGQGKPIALGEVGHLPTAQILEQQPEWLWVMPWGNLLYVFNEQETIDAWYAHPRINSLE